MAAAALVAALTALTPAALGAGAIQSTLNSFAAGNPSISALVWRLDGDGNHRVVAQVRPDSPRIPASNMKIVTGAGVLLQVGPDFRFTTRLATTANARLAGGTLTGPLYFIGGGDPMLASRTFASRYLGSRATPLGGLARNLRAAGVTTVRGPIVADESAFDAMRTGPTWPAYYSAYSQPLSGLPSNQNYAGDSRGPYAGTPWQSSATRLRAALRGVRVSQAGDLRRGVAPGTARPLASIESAPLREIVREMNVPSDNFIAETLTKTVGLYGHGTGTTAAGSARVRELLRHRGILTGRERLVDGSGLSRQNRLTATSLVRLIAAADAEPGGWGGALIASLPKGGEGTLRSRLRGAGVAGRVRAKTGFINGASSLSGRVVSRNGTRYAFSLLMNTNNIGAARATQDRVVAMLAAGRE